jgi:hypothetical protein
MKPALLAVIACLSAVLPEPATAGVSLEGTIGGQRLGVTRAPGNGEELSPMGDYGAALLVRGGPLELGLASEGTFRGGSLDRFNASALAGLAANLPVLRLELLGEFGYANLRTRAELADAAAGETGWTRFVGVRPGITAKLPLIPFRVGVWGLARWGLPGTSGAAYGLLGRIAIDF